MKKNILSIRKTKYGFAFIIILACMVLFAACFDNLNFPDNHVQIKDGYGEVRVSFIGFNGMEVSQAARTTVFPSNIFDKYVYFFKKTGEEIGIEKTPVNDFYFTLANGSYTVEVFAYNGSEEPYTLVASGISSQFDVSSGSSASVNVSLSAVNTSEKGIYNYKITIPEGSIADITLQRWPELTNVLLTPTKLTGVNEITETMELNVGSYMFTVLINKNGLKTGISEAVHIYPSLYTTYSKVFVNNDLISNDFSESPEPSVTVLTPESWADGVISSFNDEKWYKFTATANKQFIHISFGTLPGLSVQLYDSGFNSVSGITYLYATASLISLTLTEGEDYYIRITPYSGTGTYKIAFSASAFKHGTITSIITLLPETWTDGSLSSASDEQWYKFTATAITQLIHINFGTLTGLYVQLYDSTFNTVGTSSGLSGSTRFISRTLIIGHEYYIRITPSYGTGTYRIAFNTTAFPLGTDATTLRAETWVEDAITLSNNEQWYKFTATANKQFIHISFGTLTGLYVQLYDSTFNTVGTNSSLSGSTRFTSQALTIGHDYYIRITPLSSSYTGTYRIAFNDSTFISGTNINVNTLAYNEWTDGSLSSSSSERWYKFTATANTQFIHISFGTLTGLYVQLYDSTFNTVGTLSVLYGNTRFTSQALTLGHDYYIRITPLSSSYTGTYRILFNDTAFVPGTSINATTLTHNEWTDGSISSSNGEQWYKFTATTNNQFIHISFGTLTRLYVQLYDSSFNTVGNITDLTGSTRFISQTLTLGHEYYIRITPYSGTGTYKIAFNTSVFAPGTSINATTLTHNKWTDGSLSSASDEQWYKFTATANKQFIHTSFDTLGLYVQLYDSAFNTVGTRSVLYGNTRSISQTLTIGNDYYIRVIPYITGTYRIAFNDSTYAPSVNINATSLVYNEWTDDSLYLASDERWYKFTATANTQFIHISFGTLTGLYVQLYDSTFNTVGTNSSLSGSTRFTSQTLTIGNDYYIRITPLSSYTGTYRIAFNDLASTPGTIVIATTLTHNEWTDGSLSSSSSEQWYKFTATANTQFIHISFGTSSYISIQMYDSVFNTVGTLSLLYGNTRFISQTLTIGHDYYIRITPASGTGTYRITFNDTAFAPGTSINATTLTHNEWTDDSLYLASDERWYKFTAAANKQFIHISFGTLTRLYVQLYDSAFNTVGNITDLTGSTRFISQTLTIGHDYYIRITPYSGTGTYKIAFNTSASSPGTNVTTLIQNEWTDGSLSSASDERWYKFTATANNQFIHISFGTLTGLYVQLYDSAFNTVGTRSVLYGNTRFISQTLTIGHDYYIRITPADTGTYRITVSEAMYSLDTTVTEIEPNIWIEDSISSSNNEKWFRFIAIANTQKIYVSFGDLTNVNIQVYDSTFFPIGGTSLLSNTTMSIIRPVIIGQIYYIRVTFYQNYGTFQITLAEATPISSITYSANGATSGTAPITQTISTGSTITLPDGNDLIKTGFIFGGWNTNAAGTGINYNVGSSFAVGGNVTLHARWDIDVTGTWKSGEIGQGGVGGEGSFSGSSHTYTLTFGANYSFTLVTVVKYFQYTQNYTVYTITNQYTTTNNGTYTVSGNTIKMIINSSTYTGTASHNSMTVDPLAIFSRQ